MAVPLKGASHPIDIRQVELPDPSGCMNHGARNDRALCVRAMPMQCVCTSTRIGGATAAVTPRCRRIRAPRRNVPRSSKRP